MTRIAHVEIPVDILADLATYLKAHEEEIKNKDNDFGELEYVFGWMFDRQPGKRL